MLSFRKLIFGILFLISACGFSPVYTKQNSANLTGKISIQEPNTQNDFVFYSRLTDRFGEASGKYILNYAITTAKEDKAINFDGTVHRVEISGFVTFSLKDTENGVQIFSDRAAVLNAERITNKQLVVLLADKVADRISLILVDQDS